MQSEPIVQKEQIITKIKSVLPQLSKLGIKKIGIFGSMKRGDARIDSDVDILIEFQKGMKSYKKLIETRTLLEITLNKKIDLVQLEGLSKYIGPKILLEVEYIEDQS